MRGWLQVCKAGVQDMGSLCESFPLLRFQPPFPESSVPFFCGCLAAAASVTHSLGVSVCRCVTSTSREWWSTIIRRETIASAQASPDVPALVPPLSAFNRSSIWKLSPPPSVCTEPLPHIAHFRAPLYGFHPVTDLLITVSLCLLGPQQLVLRSIHAYRAHAPLTRWRRTGHP